MHISSRFTLAVHLFMCADTFQNEYKVTSDFIAASTNVNPVIIRKLLSQLKAAGLLEVARGTGGTKIAKPLDEITLQASSPSITGTTFKFDMNLTIRFIVFHRII